MVKLFIVVVEIFLLFQIMEICLVKRNNNGKKEKILIDVRHDSANRIHFQVRNYPCFGPINVKITNFHYI